MVEMMRQRFVWCGSCVILVVLGCFWSCAEQRSEDWFSSEVIELGAVDVGSSHVVKLPFRAPPGRSHELVRVLSSCSCVASSLLIPPRPQRRAPDLNRGAADTWHCVDGLPSLRLLPLRQPVRRCLRDRVPRTPRPLYCPTAYRREPFERHGRRLHPPSPQEEISQRHPQRAPASLRLYRAPLHHAAPPTTPRA
jgi:hypothetical protein